MDPITLLRKNHPEAVALGKVLKLIVAAVAADSIYFSLLLEEDLNQGMFLIVVGEESALYWDDQYQNCHTLFEDFPQFSFRMYDAQWIADEIKEGNLFFVLHCNRQQLLYSTPKSTEITLISCLQSKKFLKKVEKRFQLDIETALTIGGDLPYYLQWGNLQQAAYSLHQSIRWLYITASRFLTGEWLVAQDLKEQQLHVGCFSVSLVKIFDTDREEERALLVILNAACEAVQQNTEVPVLTLEVLHAIEAKKELLYNEIHRLFAAAIERCRYQFSLKKTPLIALDETDPLHFITNIITDTVATSAVYCFGERTVECKTSNLLLAEKEADFQSTHFYLLLLVNDGTADIPGNITDKIRTQTVGRYTVTVLMHSKKSLGVKTGEQQYFFYKVMEQGRLLFKETIRPPYLLCDAPPTRDRKRTKQYVEQRNQTAAFFKEAERHDAGRATKIKVYMLHLVVEQTCLGLIRLFLGYTPNHFSLPFLFELCEYFTPLTGEIFPKVTDKDKELLKILSMTPTALRYGCIDDVAHQDYEVLRNRCNEFVERAGEVVVRYEAGCQVLEREKEIETIRKQ